jgi:hypothetical protein
MPEPHRPRDSDGLYLAPPASTTPARPPRSVDNAPKSRPATKPSAYESVAIKRWIEAKPARRNARGRERSLHSRGITLHRLPVSKTGMGGFVHRGFESLPLRYSTGFLLLVPVFRHPQAGSRRALVRPLNSAQDRLKRALTGPRLARTTPTKTTTAAPRSTAAVESDEIGAEVQPSCTSRAAVFARSR